ncbi:ribokinase [Micromonospora cathayae]|uniref:Ribokinase n=1 Tax=Micromonospora cathayae TaxID=3028804 RepID=A0ABY7ZYK0_9ACTN|nr:ribokinase [Micromonospora sp. HUAS 3]WDZ87476.1 ribokinase [Micromonospora sp. HUAS 3]
MTGDAPDHPAGGPVTGGTPDRPDAGLPAGGTASHREPVEVLVVGSANLDRVIRLDRLPRPGETVLTGDAETGAGGKGANQAVALARLGRRVALRAAVGQDAGGDTLLAGLRRAGVDVSGVRRIEGVPTGEALILLDGDGENSIVVLEGANRWLGPADVGPARPAPAAVLVQCEVPTAAVRAALAVTGPLRILNPAPAQGVDAALLAQVDVLVPNRIELAQLTGRPVTDLDEARAALAALPVDRAVVTLGAVGALVRDGQRYELVPAPAVPVVDTTGAGDCFCATLTSALVDGLPLVEAARWAVVAAALSTRAVGAQGGLPTPGEITELLARVP